MAHSGGGKGHGAKFTRGQASFLALQYRCTLWGSWEKLAGCPHIQLGASPQGEDDVSVCLGKGVCPAGCGEGLRLLKCLDEAAPW